MATSPTSVKRKPLRTTTIDSDCFSIKTSLEGSENDQLQISPISTASPVSSVFLESPVGQPSKSLSTPAAKAAEEYMERMAGNISIQSGEKDVIVPVTPEQKLDEDMKSETGEGPGQPCASGKGKCKVVGPSAFHLLPREIIQQILYVAEPNVFDSLALLNRTWYEASQSSLLYAHQLRKCGVPVPDDPAEELLPSLKQQFNIQSRRLLFETFIRPQVTEVQLICSSPSSAGALPGGDTFRFEFSPKGQYLLALSSSRIFVIYLAGPEVAVKRELKILKKPVTAAILDDGTTLVVLSSNHIVTVYNLSRETAQIIKTLSLEDFPRAIALSPGAAVLAAAYEDGIQVYSLHPSALVTDRRSVNCDPVDSLAFSSDGLVLLGTTLDSKPPTTVIISAPFFSADLSEEESLSQMWTTQILFPRSSRDNSHATLLPETYSDDDDNSWTFTYDRTFETFRAVRVDDLRNGHTYFTSPNDGNSLSPTTLPAPNPNGGLVATGFASEKIWIYGIPTKLVLEPERGGIASNPMDRDSANSQSNTPARPGSDRSSLHSVLGRSGDSAFSPQLQVLFDKFPNVFITGKQIGDVSGLAGLKFVKSSNRERLVAVASGGVGTFEGRDGEEIIAEGGRIVVFDFWKVPCVAKKATVTIEVGDGQHGIVETLREEQRDLEAEVMLARQRTQIQRTRNQYSSPAISRLPTLRPSQSDTSALLSPNVITRTVTGASHDGRPDARGLSTISVEGEGYSALEEAVDLPYSHNDPRSRSTLTRAATAAAAARRQFGVPRHAGATRVIGPDGQPISQPPPDPEDDWVPPPPPYSPRSENEPPLPLHLLLSLQPRAATTPPIPTLQIDQIPRPLTRAGIFEGRERAASGNSLISTGSPARRDQSQRITVHSGTQPNFNSNSYLQPYAYGEGMSSSAPTSPSVGMGEARPIPYVETAYAGRTGFSGVPASNISAPSATAQSQNVALVNIHHLPSPCNAVTLPTPVNRELGTSSVIPQGQQQTSQPPMPNLTLYHQYQQQQTQQGASLSLHTQGIHGPSSEQALVFSSQHPSSMPIHNAPSIIPSPPGSTIPQLRVGAPDTQYPVHPPLQMHPLAQASPGQQYIPPNIPPPPPIPSSSASPSLVNARPSSRGRSGVHLNEMYASNAENPPNRTRSIQPSPSPLRNARQASQRSTDGRKRWGTVRRTPSRPERSARRNVMDARKRRAEREMERIAKDDGPSGSRKAGKGSCTIM